MSQLPTSHAELNEEARLELTAAAAAAERRNRPRPLVALAAVLLVIAVIYTLRAAGSLAAAEIEVQNQRTAAALMQAAITELRQLSDGDKGEIPPPDPETLAKLESLAGKVGLPARPRLVINQTDDRSASGPASKKRFAARIEGADPDALVSWLAKATGPNESGLRGLEVHSIKIVPSRSKPGSGQWDADIVLTRLERGS